MGDPCADSGNIFKDKFYMLYGKSLDFNLFLEQLVFYILTSS